MKQKGLALLLCLSVFLTGCSSGQDGNVPMTSGTAEGMEAEAVIEYTVPKSLPGILINQAGYDVKADKTAIFTGENLPDSFRVYNAETKQQVYEGQVIKKELETEEGGQLAYGSFQDLKIPGEYYLEADILGHSYTFSVGNQVNSDLLCQTLQHFRESLQEKSTLTEEEIRKSCQAVMNLLLAAELHKTAFDDAMGIAESGNEISDLIDVLLVQVRLLTEQGETVLASKDWELVSYFAAALAKFSYTYKEYDSTFAVACLQLADMAWKHMEQSGQEINEELRVMAAAELYRASGGYRYHTVIKEYGAGEEELFQSREAVYGAITYISTKQSVDIDLCSRFMKEIMTQAEKISAASKESGYQVSLEDSVTNEDILWDMIILTVVDKVISNHEYATVIENHLHYLLGRNPLAVSFVDEVGARGVSEEEGLVSVMDGGFQESALLFMLSQINDTTE